MREDSICHCWLCRQRNGITMYDKRDLQNMEKKRFRKDASVLTSGFNQVRTVMGSINCHLNGVENLLGHGLWAWLWGINVMTC